MSQTIPTSAARRNHATCSSDRVGRRLAIFYQGIAEFVARLSPSVRLRLQSERRRLARGRKNAKSPSAKRSLRPDGSRYGVADAEADDRRRPSARVETSHAIRHEFATRRHCESWPANGRTRETLGSKGSAARKSSRSSLSGSELRLLKHSSGEDRIRTCGTP